MNVSFIVDDAEPITHCAVAYSPYQSPSPAVQSCEARGVRYPTLYEWGKDTRRGDIGDVDCPACVDIALHGRHPRGES